MIFEEMKLVEAPSDGEFWAGVGIGTIIVLGGAAIFCC